MAEFKLGRIRFVWKDQWTASTVYYQDDVVAFGGKTYICTIGHNSQSNFFSDFNIVPPKWNLVSDGQIWRGDWRNGTQYRPGDIVKYGATLYITDEQHTSTIASGTETYVITVQADPCPTGTGCAMNGVFLIDGVVHPDIQMPRGRTFIWNQNDPSNLFAGVMPGMAARHPMLISTTLDGTHNGGTIYEDGVSYFLNGVEVADATAYDAGFAAATTREMRITIPQDAPDTLYYFCAQHPGMSGVASSETISVGLETDIANWTVYAEGLDWKGDWHEDFYYRENDFVKYGGSSYVCRTPHTSTGLGSNLGLEPDILRWEAFNQGLEYKGEWSSGTRYKLNDLVRYGAGIWIASTPHISATTFGEDAAYWTRFVEGFQYENDWNPLRGYQPGDIVRYGGNQYISRTSNTNIVPTTVNSDWDLFTEGFRFIGDWNEDSSNQHYKVGEVVRLGGFTYVCVQDHTTGQQPPNTTYWKQVNSGFRWRGPWLDDQEYYEGDVVRYGDSSYVCVLSHISEGDDYSTETRLGQGGGAEGSRPDLADSGQYWSIIAVGTEQSVLTDIGDLVYFSGSGPTRLPIGQNGQVLQVSAENIPSWEFLNTVEDVYHVAENGVDGQYPIYGGSVDRPFKSIRYACEQIEKGIKNQNAQFMLELNRAFIQKEVTAWIRDQIATAAPSSIWEDFDYDTLKCERDVGFVIDRIIHDLGHGGNLKTRAAAQAFLGVLSEGPFSTEEEDVPYTGLPQERQQSVAAYNYMLDVIEAVLANQAPTEIYQNITDDSAAIVDQYFNTNLRIEDGAYARVEELANIVITAISTGLSSSIPARQVSFSLVKVSTGKHYETLPIIVPAYTCVQGDELRSTQIFAQGSTIPTTDSAYTIATFDRIADVVANVVRGAVVTPTLGNTEVQSREWPLAIQAESDAVYDLVKVMKYRADWILGTMHSAYLTDPTGYSSSLQNARENILRNKDFAIAEVIAFLAEEYPALRYGKTKTRRDARYIIDALVYDLTYGGNALSIQAGLAYWDGDDNTQPQIPASIKAATIAAMNVLKNTLQNIAGDVVIVSPYQTTIVQDMTGSAGNTSVISNNIDAIVSIVDTGPSVVGTTVTLVDPTPTNGVNTTTALISDYTAISASGFDAIQDAVEAYLAANYSDVDYSVAKARRDAAIVAKAVAFDFMFNSNYQTLKAAHAYLRLSSSELFDRDDRIKEATRNSLTVARNTALGLMSNATAEARLTESYRIVDQIIFGGSSEGSICQTENQNRDYARLQLERNRNFIVAEVMAYVAQTYPGYTYDSDLCARDVGLYIDALKYDLKNPGNYKSRYVARYYANAVTGSREEDMFYLRDATGLRDCTLNGLNGDLTPPNEFGTSRVTAGAYASLDPGWGPDDFTTWIISRSPYVQGLTTFGNAAIGQKIDGALHNGGNDSITSNDFTQVISDGIGAWIINNGRAELVSVFTYYAHIGYLAETGGRIRATNGNNSYGDFGSVAEGVDPDEIAVTAIVDNSTQYSATISNVFTDFNQLMAFEYNHTGNDYTEAEYNIFGAGTSSVIVADEFRDNAVTNVKVDAAPVPTPPAVQPPLGGSGYTRISNVAQSGTTTSIFLSATDGALSTAYPNMKIYIIGGAGIGQYGIINTYDAGSKEATVNRESFPTSGWDHIIPGTPIVAPNSSSTYLIEPTISFSAPPKSTSTLTVPNGDYEAALYFETSAQYTNVATTGGSGTGLRFNVTRNGERYYLTVSNAGTGYTRLNTVTIAGTNLGGASPLNNITVTLTTVNSVTGAVVDYDFTGIAQKGLFLALPATGTAGIKSVDGITWSAETLPSPGSGGYDNIASGLINDGSSTFKQSFAVAVCGGSSVAAYTQDGDLWSTSTLPVAINTGSATDIAFGQISSTVGRFLVIAEADRDVAYSDNGGATWTAVPTALPTVGYNAITYGKGLFVAIRSGTTNSAYSTNGIAWTAGSGLPNKTWTDIVWGNGRFVALASDGTCSYSLDGITWSTSVTIASAITTNRITYGQGVFVVTASTTVMYHSEDGIVWTAITGLRAGGYKSVAFGNPNRTGKFVLLGAGGANTSGIDARIGARARGRASVSNEQIFEIRIVEPGSGYTASVPTITVSDPNNIDDVVLVPRVNSGALANPTFVNRGGGYITASAEIDAQNSNGSANFIQDGGFIAVKRLSRRPVSGSNVEFASLPGQFFKLVNTVSFLGTNPGSFTGFLQVSPPVAVGNSPADGEDIELRIRFSQVRLTGHDFLDIGTGGFDTTNYPNSPLQQPVQDNETVESNGGRVFFTATDQDGNFRVGSLFSIEQSTGVATLNADAFNIAGLQELSLGEVTLGGNSATVTEFSTDPFFTANSDNIVPTQRAVKAYIESQIGGGGASLNVNSVTAGDIFIGANTITTVSGAPINIKANVVFSGSVLGLPLAYNYFLR